MTGARRCKNTFIYFSNMKDITVALLFLQIKNCLQHQQNDRKFYSIAAEILKEFSVIQLNHHSDYGFRNSAEKKPRLKKLLKSTTEESRKNCSMYEVTILLNLLNPMRKEGLIVPSLCFFHLFLIQFLGLLFRVKQCCK